MLPGQPGCLHLPVYRLRWPERLSWVWTRRGSRGAQGLAPATLDCSLGEERAAGSNCGQDGGHKGDDPVQFQRHPAALHRL